MQKPIIEDFSKTDLPDSNFQVFNPDFPLLNGQKVEIVQEQSHLDWASLDCDAPVDYTHIPIFISGQDGMKLVKKNTLIQSHPTKMESNANEGELRPLISSIVSSVAEKKEIYRQSDASPTGHERPSGNTMAAKKSTSKYDRLAPPKILKRDPNTSLEAKSATSLTTCAIDMQRGQKQYRILKNVNNNDKNKQLNQNEVIKDRFAHKSDHGNGKTITPTVPDVIDKPIGRHELPWRKRSNKESNIDATVQKTHPSALKPEFDDFKQEKSILQKQKSNTEASKEYLNKKLYMDLQTQQGRKHSTYNNRKENSATTGKHSRNFENMNSHVHRQSQNLTSNNAEFVSPTNGSNLTLKNQLTSQKHQRKGHKKSLTQPDTVTSVSKIVSASSVVTPKQSKFFGKNPFEELITLQDLEAIANESDYTSQPIEMEADRFNNTNEPIQIVSLKELESITSDKKSKFTLQKRFDISPSAEKPKSTERWKFNLMDKPEFSKPIQIPDERELSIDRVLDNIAKLKTSNSESNLAQSTKSTEVVNGDLKIGNSSKSGKKEFRFTVVKKSGSVNYVE